MAGPARCSAVEGTGDIPDALLKAFHDAKQLKATVDQLKTTATNAAMTEVMS